MDFRTYTAKVNAYLSKIKSLCIGKSLASDSHSKGNAVNTALAGIKVAIKYELPANEFKFIINRNDFEAYIKEAEIIYAEKKGINGLYQ